MYEGLKEIEKRFDYEILTLIPQYYYPCYSMVIFSHLLLFILKVKYLKAGYGKIQVR
jgi:hypothetical protein